MMHSRVYKLNMPFSRDVSSSGLATTEFGSSIDGIIKTVEQSVPCLEPKSSVPFRILVVGRVGYFL